jgi:hypothetical protein
MSSSPPTEPGAEPAALGETWQTCGSHRYAVRGDVLVFVGSGTMGRADIVTLYEQRAALQARRGYALVLIDARGITGTPADARRYAAEHRPDPPFVGAVILLGASLLQRTVISLVSAAARLLGRSERDLGVLSLAADAAEAEALIESKRRSFCAGAPAG